MKKGKRFLALVLGGAMAAGSLFLQTPVTAQAKEWPESCTVNVDAHIKSCEIAVVDKKVTVTYDVEIESEGAYFMLYFYTYKLGKTRDFRGAYYDCRGHVPIASFGRPDPLHELIGEDLGTSGTFVFPGNDLGGKEDDPFTYYIYGYVEKDVHEGTDGLYHYGATYLGKAVPATGEVENASIPESDGSSSGSTSSGSASVSSSSGSSVKTGADFYREFEDDLCGQIQTAESGSTVVMKEGTTTLSNAMMKALLEKGDVSLRLEFTYEDTEYVIIIPAGEALDDDIAWYGPLYLAAHFGNSAGAGNTSGAGGTYVVQSGDTLSKIAAANHMTLQELLAKNPQIRDANKISVGQTINR